MVFAGKLERWKYVFGGPPTVEDERNMLSFGEGKACCGDIEKFERCVAG